MTPEEHIEHLENRIALLEQATVMFVNALAVCVTRAGGSLEVTAVEVAAADVETLRCQQGLTEQTWMIGRPEGDDDFWNWFFRTPGDQN